MKMSAIMTAPRTELGAASTLYGPHAKNHEEWWERMRISHRAMRGHSASGSHLDFGHHAKDEQRGGHLLKFLSYFSGPIIWTLEITAVLLIVTAHSVDFVGVVIIANLVLIVMMMVVRASLGLWQDAHPASSYDVFDRHPTRRAHLRHS